MTMAPLCWTFAIQRLAPSRNRMMKNPPTPYPQIVASEDAEPMHTILRKRFRLRTVNTHRLTGVNLFIPSALILTPPTDEVTIQFKSITCVPISSYLVVVKADLEGVGVVVFGQCRQDVFQQTPPITFSNQKRPGVFL